MYKRVVTKFDSENWIQIQTRRHIIIKTEHWRSTICTHASKNKRFDLPTTLYKNGDDTFQANLFQKFDDDSRINNIWQIKMVMNICYSNPKRTSRNKIT